MKKGQALVEMMVGMGIAAAIMPALITSFFAARGGTAQEQVRMQASARLREIREVLRIIKEDNWASIAINGTYHLTQNSGVWGVSSGPEVNLDGLFVRQVIISNAYRTSNNALSTNSIGNVLDPSVKHVVASVSWTSPIASSVIADYYLMRLENQTYIETLYADFGSPGTVHRSTFATNIAGGEVQLSSQGSGIGDWCSPSLVMQSLDLDGQGVTTGLSAIQGHAYATTGDNASGHALYSVNITNPSPPTLPIPTQGSFFDPTPQRKAYGLFATSDYIYATGSKNTLDIVSASTMTEVGKFSVGNKTGDSVTVSGNIGYVSSGTNLYAFNLSGNINPAPQLATTTLADSGKRLVVIGNYLYVATSSTTKQFQVFDVSNVLAGTITEVGNLNVGNNHGSVDIFVDSSGSYAYLVTSYASPDFFTIDLTSKTTPIVVGSYTTTNNMDPKGVTVISQDARAIIVGSGTDLYQVLNISVPISPSRCSPALSLPGITTINAISSVIESDGDAYSYILTNDSAKEFQMIQGGPGGGGGGSAKIGVFDSKPFVPVSSATFNRFDLNTSLPQNTYARYQIAVAAKVNGSCTSANYTFVGPNKDQNAWFTESSIIPLGTSGSYTNPGECFRYRVSLSTDNLGVTPVFNDITINYSL